MQALIDIYLFYLFVNCIFCLFLYASCLVGCDLLFKKHTADSTPSVGALVR